MNNNTEVDEIRTIGGSLVEMFGSLFIVLEHAFAMFLISKCKNVQKSVKFLVSNLCIIDIIAGLWGFVRAHIRFHLIDKKITCMLDVLFTTCVLNVSALLVSAIAIDRYTSVFRPMTYTQIVNKRVLATACCVFWTLGAVIAVIALYSEFAYTDDIGCELRMSQQEVFPWLLVLLRVVCIFIITFSYSRMYSKIVSLGKVYSSEIKRRELRSIAKILLIVSPHLILHISYVFIFFLKPILNIKNAISIISLIYTIIILLDALIYVFRFKECRINMAIYMCFCRKEYRDRKIKKRTLLYGTFLDENPQGTSSSIVRNQRNISRIDNESIYVVSNSV
ncbi:olfactory receptor 867-like [Mytilus californianus]|uniref:olfactory receptor 867-like n=1 Tax=Mytilus californianus TaxID=6549 RepID=UPI0022482C61|nr:olfactory receptor 867-like [Mytilus californianus]XP_052068296.1 olfactory receptor 867-like [Mytilus californianus]